MIQGSGTSIRRAECAAVVVSYNSKTELPACLAAIDDQKDVDLHIYLVDNASSDGSVELVRSRFPRVHVIANRENVGFGRANNQVLEAVHADYFALVNPDAVLAPGAVRACIELMEKEPDIGVAATRLVYPDGTLHPSCHAFLGLRNLIGETLLMDRAFSGWGTISSLNMPGFRHDRRLDVDWIQGAWLVVRGEVCRQIGGFDPDFFVNGEEMEWCYRIRKAGWRVTFLPEPPVVHIGGASTSPVAGEMFVEVLKGRVRFLEKHRNPLIVLGARIVIAVSVLLRTAARESMNLWRRLLGQAVPESLRLRLIMFRTATSWVFRGMPVTPFRLPGDGR